MNFTLGTTIWRHTYYSEFNTPIPFNKIISFYVYRVDNNIPITVVRTLNDKFTVYAPDFLGSDVAGKTGVLRLLYSDSNIPEG